MDHVAITTTDIEKDSKELERLGFKHRFTEYGLKNAKEKAPLLRHWADRHDISVFDGIEGIALELTMHHRKADYLYNKGFVPVSDDGSIVGVVRAVDSIEKSRTFYAALGLRPEDKNGFLHLHVDSPVEKLKSRIIVGKTTDPRDSEPMYLDDAGFPCVAFISTDLEADAKKLHGEETQYITDDFKFKVNNKKMKICFVIGPSGEIIELIEMVR